MSSSRSTLIVTSGVLMPPILLFTAQFKRTSSNEEEFLEVWQRHRDLFIDSDRPHENLSVLFRQSLEEAGPTATEIWSVVGLLSFEPFDPRIIEIGLQWTNGQSDPEMDKLVRFGLIVRQEGSRRYRVYHSLLHTFARHKLIPPTDAIRLLKDYYMPFTLKQRQCGLDGLQRLDAEFQHITTIIEGVHSKEDWGSVIALVNAIDPYLVIRGHWSQREKALLQGLQASQALKQKDNEEAFQGNLGNVYFRQGKYEQALECHQRALGMASVNNDLKQKAIHLNNIGNTVRQSGQHEQAIQHYLKALEIAQQVGEIDTKEKCLSNLSKAYTATKQWDRALKVGFESLAIAEMHADSRAQAASLASLGAIHHSRGVQEHDNASFVEAIVIYEKALVTIQV